jgi:very-short-patch-repair endonuclease
MPTTDRYTKSAAQRAYGFPGRSAAAAAVWVYLIECDERDQRRSVWRYQHRVGTAHVDFAWPSLRIALDIDASHHWTPEALHADRLRDSELRTLGWIVHRLDAHRDTGALLAQLVPVVRVANVLYACGYEP